MPARTGPGNLGQAWLPVILRPEAEQAWLDPGVDDPARLLPLVGPYPADLMAADLANPAMNKPSFEGPDCLVAPGASGPTTGT